MVRRHKRSVTFDGSVYKVRSDHVLIPDFLQMSRIEAILWLNKYTYARGYSKPHPLRDVGEAIQLQTR